MITVEGVGGRIPHVHRGIALGKQEIIFRWIWIMLFSWGVCDMLCRYEIHFVKLRSVCATGAICAIAAAS